MDSESPVVESDTAYKKKVVIIGDSGVGKSCLLHQFAEGTFTESYNGTIGVDFVVNTLQVDGNKIKLQVWDTAGQERFRSLTPSYYRGADAVIIVYDLAQKESFDSVSKWMQEIESFTSENVTKWIVGNKSDLTDKRAVTKDQAEELCSRVGSCQHIETSAKDATNVNELFTTVARQLIEINTEETVGRNHANVHLRRVTDFTERSKANDSSLITDKAAEPGTDYLKKVIILGDPGVGKSCLLLRFVDEAFTDSYICTIGVDFKIRTLQVDGSRIKLQVWDTAGQERFRTITTSYYRGANAFIIVYDVTNKESFDSVSNWLQEIQRYASENIIKVIVGTKSDLTEKRAVTKQQAEELCSSVDCQHIETSAKDATNVDALFTTVARQLITKQVEISTGRNPASAPPGPPPRTRSRYCNLL